MRQRGRLQSTFPIAFFMQTPTLCLGCLTVAPKRSTWACRRSGRWRRCARARCPRARRRRPPSCPPPRSTTPSAATRAGSASSCSLPRCRTSCTACATTTPAGAGRRPAHFMTNLSNKLAGWWPAVRACGVSCLLVAFNVTFHVCYVELVALHARASCSASVQWAAWRL